MEKLTNEYKIEFTKGDTYALAIKFKNITEDLRTAYFSVKENPDDTPLIQKSLGAGIDKIDDRGYKNEKTYKFQIQPADTVNLEAKVQYLYDIQVCVGNVVKTVLHGVFILGNTITGTGVTTEEMEVAVDDELETEMSTIPATNGVEYEQDPVACAKIGDMATLETDNKETVVKAINEVNKHADTNAEEVNKIKNGTIEVPKSQETKNVTEQINGKNISEIFEDDGKTIVNSTNAKKINGIEITQDEKGVIRIGGNVIPYSKLVCQLGLWYGIETATNAFQFNIPTEKKLTYVYDNTKTYIVKGHITVKDYNYTDGSPIIFPYECKTHGCPNANKGFCAVDMPTTNSTDRVSHIMIQHNQDEMYFTLYSPSLTESNFKTGTKVTIEAIYEIVE